MSACEMIDFACPKCRQVARVTIRKVINATQDPAARALLMEGKVNYFACSKCDQKGYLLVSLLYHDIERRFLVQYHPFPALRSEEFLREFDSSGQVKLDESRLPERLDRRVDYFREMHLVFDMAELVRYVVFREKLFELHSKSNPDAGPRR